MAKLILLFTLILSFNCVAKEVSLKSSEVVFNLVGNAELKLEKANLQVRCLRKATFFERFNNGLKDYMTCDDFKINGRVQSLSTTKVELKKLSENLFQLPNIKVSYSTRRSGNVCLVVNVEFQGIPYYSSSDLYVNLNDNYSLLSYCSVRELPVTINDYVYNHNRVENLELFGDQLERGIDIRLKP